MKFSKFFIIIMGISWIGISIGYVLGYFLHKLIPNCNAFYFAVPMMGCGCFMTIYGSLFLKNKK